MSLATSLAVKPLSPALGAEIVGLDLRQELGAETVADILDAWHQHLVLVFRDQQLSEDEQIRSARHFGVLEKRRRPSEARNEAAMIKSHRGGPIHLRAQLAGRGSRSLGQSLHSPCPHRFQQQ